VNIILLFFCSNKNVVLGGKESSMNNWQKMIVDIPNEKLILSIKEARQSYMPTRIQALVVIHQRLDSMRHIFH
jgi:hypothetical protein